MAFWRKRKKTAATSAASNEESVPAVTTVSPDEEKVANGGTVSTEDLHRLADKSKELFANLPSKKAGLPAGAIIDSKQELRLTLPKDDFSFQIYGALKRAAIPEDSYGEFIKALEKKAKLEERFRILNYRVEKLARDVKAREESFGEIKFEAYLDSTTQEDELDESEKEQLDENLDLFKKREEYKKSLVVLAQLEHNRALLKEDLVSILSAFKSEFSNSGEKVLLRSIEDRLEELETIQNVATSDGEKANLEDPHMVEF